MKHVTALVLTHSSMTNILSFVVPRSISLTIPALPSFSAVNSEKRGTIRPPVAIAINSISGPPTHRTFVLYLERCFLMASNGIFDLPLEDYSVIINDLLHHRIPIDRLQDLLLCLSPV